MSSTRLSKIAPPQRTSARIAARKAKKELETKKNLRTPEKETILSHLSRLAKWITTPGKVKERIPSVLDSRSHTLSKIYLSKNFRPIFNEWVLENEETNLSKIVNSGHGHLIANYIDLMAEECDIEVSASPDKNTSDNELNIELTSSDENMPIFDLQLDGSDNKSDNGIDVESFLDNEYLMTQPISTFWCMNFKSKEAHLHTATTLTNDGQKQEIEKDQHINSFTS